MRSLFAAIVAVFLAAPAFGAQQQPTDDSPQSVPVTAGGQAPDADTAPQSAQAPVHTHTGWKTLLKDTGRDFVAFPKRPSTWTLLGIGAAGALATYPADDHVETHIVRNRTTDRFFSVGQWVGSVYAQTAASVGLWAVGRYIVAPAANESRTNKYSEIGFDLMRAQIVSQVLAHGMKYSIRRDRPTGECCAFPSGHSATAFAAASVLERHFGYRASWPALVAASYVGASRLVDNRHFLSDVLMGAGVGIASGWTVVGTRGRSAFTLQPVPMKRGMMIAVTRVQSPPRSTESSRRSLRRLPSDRGRESPVGR